jgi:CMP-N-acetylneuraminic acid synthetase
MSKYPDTIAVIPARRGSKRLALKNLQLVAGKPLLAYSIEAALAADFNPVYVATEDQEIADIAIKYGATVPKLVPATMTDDLNPSWEPCVYLADELAKEGLTFTNLLCLQPSSVLRNADDISAGMKVFATGEYDYVVSVTPIDPHYFHWAVVPGENNKWGMYFGKQFLKDRHQLPPVFRPNGAIKIANIEKLRVDKNFFGANLGVSSMPEERSLHVITAADLKIAEALMR